MQPASKSKSPIVASLIAPKIKSKHLYSPLRTQIDDKLRCYNKATQNTDTITSAIDTKIEGKLQKDWELERDAEDAYDPTNSSYQRTVAIDHTNKYITKVVDRRNAIELWWVEIKI